MSTWHPLTGHRVVVRLVEGREIEGLLNHAIDGWVTLRVERTGYPSAIESYPDARIAMMRQLPQEPPERPRRS